MKRTLPTRAAGQPGRPTEVTELVLWAVAVHELEFAGVDDLTPAALSRLLEDTKWIKTAIRHTIRDYKAKARMSAHYRRVHDKYVPHRAEWLKAAARWRVADRPPLSPETLRMIEKIGQRIR
jgi:hypothetical protein